MTANSPSPVGTPAVGGAPQQPSLPGWLLVLTRVTLGASFVFSDHGNTTPDELTGFLAFAQQNAFGWYARFLGAVVIPHAVLFGKAIVFAELAIGLALILGAATRLAAASALWLLVNYLCAKGRLPWYPGIDSSDILLCLIVFFTAAGRTFGLDRLLYRRFPRLPLW